jgi:exopolysaccharide biosynthesis polyprenyl glycosylphosphotransferase
MTIRQADRVLFSWLLDSAVLALSLFLASRLRAALPMGPEFAPASEVPVSVYVLVLAIWGLLSFSLGVPGPGLARAVELVRFVGVHLLTVVLLAALMYFTSRQVSRYLFVYFVGLSLGAMLGWRLVASWLGPRLPERPARVVIVGTGPEAVAVYQRIHAQYHAPVTVIGFVTGGSEPGPLGLPGGARLLGDLSQLARLDEQETFDEVVIALPALDGEQLTRIITAVERLQARIYLYFEVQGVVLVYGRASDEAWHLVDIPSSVIDAHEWLVKRFVDLLLAGLLSILLLPVMALIALAIKLESPGPVIFRQHRIGEHGRPFTLFKYRTMIDGAEAQQYLVNQWTDSGEVIHKHPYDPRVTRLGRFLRRWSLDELPELWNILRGEMSLVGPRPELTWIVEQYHPEQYRRFLVPPGLTGFWQVKERSLRPMHLAFSDDLYYIENYSLWLDLWILLKTPLAVLRGRGAF